jgi:hypothetical protein
LSFNPRRSFLYRPNELELALASRKLWFGSSLHRSPVGAAKLTLRARPRRQ